MKLHDKHYFLSCVDVFPFAFDSNSPWQVVLGEGIHFLENIWLD